MTDDAPAETARPGGIELPRVVLDTSVLMAQDRHWLWAAAYDGYYVGFWSAFIVGELVRVRMRRGLEHGVPYVVLRNQLNDLVHVWSDVLTIVDYRRIPSTQRLADPDDEPVLATARVAGASSIVSLNTRDFPTATEIEQVQFTTPADFWKLLVQRHPAIDQRNLESRRHSL